MAPQSLHGLFRRIRGAIDCLTTSSRPDDSFRSLAENSNDPIARLDREGRYLYANPAHCALAGLKASRIIGRNCEEIGAPEHAARLFQDNVRNVVQGGNERRFEIALPHADGPRWFEARFMPEPGADGRIGSVLSVLREITERRQLEQQQAELERRQRALLDGIAERVWLKDLSGRYLAVNQRLAGLTGHSPHELIGKTAHDILPFTEATEYEADDRLVIQKNAMVRGEHHSALDGTWRETIKVPFHDADGRITGLICSSRDISRHKEALEKLEISEHRLRLALRAAKSGVWEWQPGAPASYWSEEAYAVIGLKPGDAPPNFETWLSRIHESDRERVRAEIEHCMQTGSEHRTTYRVILEDGNERWVSDVGVVHGTGASRRMVGINTDVTENKILEKQRLELEFAQQALLDGIADSAWLKDLDGRFLAVNLEYERRSGMPRDQIIGRKTEEFRPAELSPTFVAEDRQVIQTGMPLRTERALTKDGTILWRELIKVPVKDHQGRVIGTAGVSRDVTARKHIEQELQQSSQMLHAIIGASPNAIIAYNNDQKVMFWNPAAEHMFGWKASEVIGGALPNLHAGHRDDLEALKSGTLGKQTLTNVETTLKKRDGSLIEVLLSGAALRDTTGQVAGSVVICVDITERNREQRALVASEEQFRLLAEDAQAVFWISDRLFSRIDYISPGFDEMWRMPREEVFRDPKAWMRHIHADDLPVVESFLRSQAEGLPAAAEVRLSLPNGAERWIRARSFPHNSSRLDDCVTGIVSDITDVKKQAAERLSQVEQQRDALVREVHHRIKNHLQGVAGLLRMHESETRGDKKILERAITQIQSVAIIRGLQGLKTGSEVILCEMVPAIVKMMESLGDIKTELATDAQVDQPVRVAEAETVPVALILTEMISNAIKHNDPPDAPIRIAITTTLDSAKVRVINSGKLAGIPDSSAAGSAGLDLVKALMPPHGATFALDNTEAGVEAQLLLHYPAVTSIKVHESPEHGN